MLKKCHRDTRKRTCENQNTRLVCLRTQLVDQKDVIFFTISQQKFGLDIHRDNTKLIVLGSTAATISHQIDCSSPDQTKVTGSVYLHS